MLISRDQASLASGGVTFSYSLHAQTHFIRNWFIIKLLFYITTHTLLFYITPFLLLVFISVCIILIFSIM